jgi:hypothetical protein
MDTDIPLMLDEMPRGYTTIADQLSSDKAKIQEAQLCSMPLGRLRPRPLGYERDLELDHVVSFHKRSLS